MTGRRVVGFLSETHIDPSFSIEFFRLAPISEAVPVEPGEREAWHLHERGG